MFSFKFTIFCLYIFYSQRKQIYIPKIWIVLFSIFLNSKSFSQFWARLTHLVSLHVIKTAMNVEFADLKFSRKNKLQNGRKPIETKKISWAVYRTTHMIFGSNLDAVALILITTTSVS